MFTRYGDEGALAGFTALLQALAAFAADRGDSIQSIRSVAASIACQARIDLPITMGMLQNALLLLYTVACTPVPPS